MAALELRELRGDCIGDREHCTVSQMLLPALEGFSHQGIRLNKQFLLISFSAMSSLAAPKSRTKYKGPSDNG